MLSHSPDSHTIVGETLSLKLTRLSPELQKDIEAWIVNTVKIQMIKKLDNYLYEEGRGNTRKLFLVPVFTVSEITKRVEEQAPEIRTLFYKELITAVGEMEKRLR